MEGRNRHTSYGLAQITDERHSKVMMSWYSSISLRYSITRKCVSSRSAVLILVWSFALGLWNGIALNPDLYVWNFVKIYSPAAYGFVAILLCFFPLAGFLADVKYGRYKTVIRTGVCS